MNNKVYLTLAAILVLGVGGYFLASKNSGSPNSNSSSPSAQTSPSSGGLNSLKNLLMAGMAQSCTFSSKTDTYSSDGTVYTASGKVRGDFSSTSNGKTTKSHMIVDGKISYIWTDGQKTGFKTTFETQTSASPSGSGASTSGNFDVNANMNYNCKPWITDNSMFTLPTGVQFMSTEMLQQNLPNIPTPQSGY